MNLETTSGGVFFPCLVLSHLHDIYNALTIVFLALPFPIKRKANNHVTLLLSETAVKEKEASSGNNKRDPNERKMSNAPTDTRDRHTHPQTTTHNLMWTMRRKGGKRRSSRHYIQRPPSPELFFFIKKKENIGRKRAHKEIGGRRGLERTREGRRNKGNGAVWALISRGWCRRPGGSIGRGEEDMGKREWLANAKNDRKKVNTVQQRAQTGKEK